MSNLTNSTVDDPYDLNPQEQQTLGTVLFIIGVVFSTRPYFNKNLSYQLMIHVGFIEVMNIVMMFQTSIPLTFNVDLGDFILRTSTAFWTFDWWVVNFLVTILALNRSDALIGFLDYCLSKRGKKRLFQFLLLISYAICLIVLTLYLIPGFGAEDIGLNTIREQYNSSIVSTGRTLAQILYIISYLFYLSALVYMIVMRLKISSKNKIIDKHELILFIQAMIICGYRSGMVWMKNFPPNTRFVYGVFWCLNFFEVGYNPFMYYIFNRRLRRELHGFFRVTSVNRTSTIPRAAPNRISTVKIEPKHTTTNVVSKSTNSLYL